MKKVHILGFCQRLPVGRNSSRRSANLTASFLRRYDNSDMIAAAILQDAVNVGCIIDVMVGKVKCFWIFAPSCVNVAANAAGAPRLHTAHTL